MKKNNTPPTLEELLASVEHAGRDSRRQQQLAEMIEHLAADEAARRRRAVRLWSVRLVAAACLLLFVITLTRLWQPLSQPVGPQMAQAPQVRPSIYHMVPAVTPSRPTVSTAHVRLAVPAASLTPKPVLPSNIVEAEPLKEAVPSLPIVEADLFVEPAPSQLYAEADDAQQLPATDFPDASPEPALAAASPEPAPEPEAAQPRSIFRLRHAEPSLMTDNTLSFRII